MVLVNVATLLRFAKRYIHTHKRFDCGFKYFKLKFFISINASQYIGTG